MKDLYLIQLIDKLTSIYLTKGVQPSELADSIFDLPYTSMSSKKNFDTIEVILTFKENCDVTYKEQTRHIKYIYNLDRYLIEISEAISSQPFKVTWDRERSISATLVEIRKRLHTLGCNAKQVEKILSTLPISSEIKNKTKLSLVS